MSRSLQGEVLQIGVEVYETHIPNAFPNVFSGIALITTGLLFLTSLYHSSKKLEYYRGYLFAAWMLTMLLMLLNIIELFASLIDAYYPVLLRYEPEE